jgi:hypothetical protein
MMEEIKHEKCNRCKCWRTPDQFLNDKGRKLKTCLNCRDLQKKSSEKNKCEHNRRKYQCKECGGSAICIHNRHKSSCKECGGISICIHNREKAKCKECVGVSICIHNRQKQQCKECGGVSICIHNREKQQCKECDPMGHLRKIVSCRVQSALKSNKSKHSIEYLGCTIDEFKQHIESQFEDGMNWDNHGEWHIDHIVPIKYETPTMEEVIERLHWSNTQPLWASDNISKGNRFIG